MGMRVRRFDYCGAVKSVLRITWDEGASIGKEEDRPFLSGPALLMLIGNKFQVVSRHNPTA